MQPVARSITSKRTWSRKIPRRSGGSFALNSGGNVNVNGALILICHPERSRRTSLLINFPHPNRRQGHSNADSLSQLMHSSFRVANLSAVSRAQLHLELRENVRSKRGACNDI